MQVDFRPSSQSIRHTALPPRAARIRSLYVICEGSYDDLLRGNYRSDMNPRAAWEPVLALQERFGIPFFMAGGVQVAASLCESILMRWWKERTATGPWAYTKNLGCFLPTHDTRDARSSDTWRVNQNRLPDFLAIAPLT